MEEFFATIIKDFSYAEDIAKRNLFTRKTIQERKNLTKKLQTNNQTPDKPSKIEIALELSEVDYENIGFVCKYSSKINAIISKYSKLNLSFPQYKLQNLIELPHTLKLTASFDEKAQEFKIDESKLNEYELFILNAIRYQKLFQIIITLFNRFERKAEERKRYLLKKSFAILNSDRTDSKFDSFIDPNQIINDFEYSRNSLIGYTGCVYKIWSSLEQFSQEQILASQATPLSGETIDEQLKKSDFFSSLSYMIQKYFNKQLKVEYINGMISLYMTDDQERVSYFDDLSDGEKSLLTIIF